VIVGHGTVSTDPDAQGATTIRFVKDGIHAALERARDATGASDVKIGGGASAVRQYLQAGFDR
jgi:dihydrofolate reductase